MPTYPWDEQELSQRRSSYRTVINATIGRFNFSLSSTAKTLLLWLVILGLIVVLWRLFTKETMNVSYAQLATVLRTHQAKSWSITEGAITVVTSKGNQLSAAIPAGNAQDVWTLGVASGASLSEVPADVWKQPIWLGVAGLIAFGALLIARSFLTAWAQTRNAPMLSLTRSNASLLSGRKMKLTFRDYGGPVPPEITDIVGFLREPQKFTKLGAAIPAGLLLVGPTGSGKTMLAMAIAGEANAPVFSLAGSAFAELLPGVGAARVRDLFRTAERNAPCIVIIDNLDAVARRRSRCPDPLAFEQELTLSQLLYEFDGLKTNDGVVVVGITDRPDLLDEALVRPGRFDRVCSLPHAGETDLVSLFQRLTRNIPLSDDVDGKEIVAMLQAARPMAGRDTIALLVNEATLEASRYDMKKVNKGSFIVALEERLPQRDAALVRPFES